MIPSNDRTFWIARNVLPHEPALRAWLGRRIVAGLEIDDVVQETYAVLAGLGAVDHIISPRAYAFSTAQSIIIRHLRRARVAQLEPVDDAYLQELPGDGPTPERELSAREELRRVADVIASLPAKCREAFMLRRVEGISQRDIARRMGISENTVEKHIGRALRVLAEAVKYGGSRGADTSLQAETKKPDEHGRSSR